MDLTWKARYIGTKVTGIPKIGGCAKAQDQGVYRYVSWPNSAHTLGRNLDISTHTREICVYGLHPFSNESVPLERDTGTYLFLIPWEFCDH